MNPPNDYEPFPSLEDRLLDRIATDISISPKIFDTFIPEAYLALVYYDEGYLRGELEQTEPELPLGDTYNKVYARLLAHVREERDRLRNTTLSEDLPGGAD